LFYLIDSRSSTASASATDMVTGKVPLE